MLQIFFLQKELTSRLSLQEPCAQRSNRLQLRENKVLDVSYYTATIPSQHMQAQQRFLRRMLILLTIVEGLYMHAGCLFAALDMVDY